MFILQTPNELNSVVRNITEMFEFVRNFLSTYWNLLNEHFYWNELNVLGGVGVGGFQNLPNR